VLVVKDDRDRELLAEAKKSAGNDSNSSAASSSSAKSSSSVLFDRSLLPSIPGYDAEEEVSFILKLSPCLIEIIVFVLSV